VSQEIVFGLENASWPALLVDARGIVMRANPSALGVFGSAFNGSTAPLSSVWSKDNGETPDQFLSRWEQKPFPTAQVKYKTAEGADAEFCTAVCAITREGRKWFVLQMITAGQPGSTPPTNAGEKNSNTELATIHKQKLDCALQLARTVSLDFNNALTSVLGHTSLLIGKAEPGHPWRSSLLEIEKSAARAAEISNELGVFSQQEKQTRRAPPGNLNEVVMRCVDFFKTNLGDKVAWNLNLEKELFASRFDEAKVQQALTKVLENAVEAVNGSGKITVQTHNVELTTPAQDRNVRLKPGKGATARIYLPAEKHVVSHNGGGSKADLQGAESILIVDDERMLLTMAETIFTEYGYKVFTVNTGQKALTLLSNEELKVDLLITDLVMPGMGGRELIERARALQPGLKILCMSGCVLTPDQQVGLQYLQKPFSSRDLLSKARHVLGKN
jgi:CheY-like chemotaxis protein